MISIKGLDKALVLQALYNDSKQQGLGVLDFTGKKPMTLEEAKNILGENEDFYFDYLNGRVLKSDITEDEFDPWLYDRDNGNGAAKRALEHLLGDKNES